MTSAIRQPESSFITANGIKLHYLQYRNANKPNLLLLHGLTANAFNFSGVCKAGLIEHFNIVALDLRGRGLSEKPAFGYAMEDHAQDVIALLQHLQWRKTSFVGHSFGALLSVYMSVHYPEKIDKLVLLDAAAQMNPKTGEMLATSLSRLDVTFASWEAYISHIKKSPFLTFWDEEMEAYYKADVATAVNGEVEPRSNIANILQVIHAVGEQDWRLLFSSVTHSTLLLFAGGAYAMGMPLLYEHDARDTVNQMPHAQLQEVCGNHATMLYGRGAVEIKDAIVSFME